MRLAIIVTYSDSDLWKKSVAWQIEESFKETEVRTARILENRILILCQAPSNELSESDAIVDSRLKTTPWLIELGNSETYGKAEIYVAVHWGYADLRELRREISNRRLRAAAEFNHEPGKTLRKLYDYLLELVEETGGPSFDAAIDAIDRTQGMTHAQRLSTLKHRLAHVFLPVSVDLHAWRDSDYDDFYLQELRESYRTDEGRLERARNLLYKESSGGDNIEKLLGEIDLEDDESWAAIKRLLPPKSYEEEIEQKRPASYEHFLKAKAVLESLMDRNKLLELRTELRHENQFGAWCKELDEKLSQLAVKIDQ
jgi:hypothetical protein